jgi:DnaA family protein
MSGPGDTGPGAGASRDYTVAASLTSPQLTLGLALRDSARFESFYTGPNAELVVTLRASARGQGEPFLYISGSAGMGKTHLLQAACFEAGLAGISTAFVPLAGLDGMSPAILEGLEQMHLVCLDDVQAIAGNEAWEHAVFDLFNRVRAAGATLLVAGSRRPDQCGFSVPDLASRLGWGVTYVLKPLPDEDVIAALTHRARGRGLELPEDTAQFLLKRIPRDLPSVFDLLDRLDEASMIEQRRLTIPFVKSVLERLQA